MSSSDPLSSDFASSSRLPESDAHLTASRMDPSQPSSSAIYPSHSHSYSASSRPLLSPSVPSTSLSPSPSRLYLHPGCVLCSVVSAAAQAQAQSRTQLSNPAHLSQPGSSHANAQSIHSLSDGTPSPSPTATTFLQGQSSRSRAAPYPQPFAPSSSSSGVFPEQEIGSTGAAAFQAAGREIVYHDRELTVYLASGKERLCPDGRHLVMVMNRHVERVYDLGPADIPVLSNMLTIAEQIFRSTITTRSSTASSAEQGAEKLDMRVGFVGSIVRDPQSPHAHLHAHALYGPVDTSLPGATLWRRNVVFGGLNWWSIEDLRAEIRESTSNNRIKSGYADRRALINRVPDAGAAVGAPNALEPDPYADDPTDSSTETQPPSRKGKTPVRAGSSRTDMERSVSTSSRAALIPQSSASEGRRNTEGYADVDLR